MIETRKQYTVDGGLNIEVVFDDELKSLTYMSITDESEQHEVNLTPEALSALTRMLNEAHNHKVEYSF